MWLFSLTHSTQWIWQGELCIHYFWPELALAALNESLYPSLCKLSSCTMEGREFPHEHLIMTPSLKVHQNNLHEKLVCYIKWKQNSVWPVWILPGPRKPHCEEFFLSQPHNMTCVLWAHGFNNEALVRHHRARGNQAECDYSSWSDQNTHSGPTALWKLLKHSGWDRAVEWKGGRTLHGKL